MMPSVPLSAFLSLLLLVCNAGAAFIPVTWNICGLELTNGQQVTGSFVFDANIPAPNPPYSNINIQSGLNYRHVLPNSVGSSTFLLALADPAPQAGQDLTNKPTIGMTFTQALTDSGGTVVIATSDTTLFAGVGSCFIPSCLNVDPGLRFAKNNPFVSTSPCPSGATPTPAPGDGGDDDDNDSCDGPTDFFSFFSWLFCIVFKFIGSLF